MNPTSPVLVRFLVAIAILPSTAAAQLQFDELVKRHLPKHDDLTLAATLVDVDGDGDADLVFGNRRDARLRGGQNRLYLNDGTGIFTDATASRLPADLDLTNALAGGDVDGDGDPDLVLGNNGQNRLYTNDGRGVFTEATAARMPSILDQTAALALEDLDLDGDLDLVVANEGFFARRQNRLYLNDGAGTFADATSGRMQPYDDHTSDVAVGDVDGDGDPDLVFGNLLSQNRLYLNDGTGRFTDATAARMPSDADRTLSVALDDVDGDGDLDLLCGNSMQQNRLYLNDGTGTFTDATAMRMPSDNDRTLAMAVGDVDADGDSDLVFANAERQNRLYLNDGTGTFTDVTPAGMPADVDSTGGLALGDVDGDGNPDLVLGNSGRNRLYLNDGRGAFTDATATRTPAYLDFTTTLALGDVDGDGDRDLALGNAGPPGRRQNRLYLNDARAASTTFPPRACRRRTTYP